MVRENCSKHPVAVELQPRCAASIVESQTKKRAFNVFTRQVSFLAFFRQQLSELLSILEI